MKEFKSPGRFDAPENKPNLGRDEKEKDPFIPVEKLPDVGRDPFEIVADKEEPEDDDKLWPSERAA
ncbi:MAG TPA: hypothetical protein VJH63_00115 [Candidatus Paceibacterota bacterium]